MLLGSRPFARLLVGLAPLLAAAPALAQVTLTCDQAVVTSRVPCVLTAAHEDGKPRAWKWSVAGVGDAAQLLESIAPDRARVRTPVTLVERTFTVVAEDSHDPSVTGTFVLRITPNPQPGSCERALVEGIFPEAFVPSMRPFLGRPERPRTLLAGGPEQVRRIAFCDDAAMGALDRCWILAKGTGLEAFKVAGDPVPIPGGPFRLGRGCTCVAVATLPPGPGPVPEGAPRLVYCLQQTSPTRGVWIHALEADGRQRLLAGGPSQEVIDGPGGTARFEWVTDLALDRGGNVYVCDLAGTIRKISLEGQVSTLSSKRSGRGDQAVHEPLCLALDSATGELYVGEADRVVKLDPAGKLTPVIGGRGRALADGRSHQLAPLSPGRVPPDTRFHLGVFRMALHGRELILAHHGGIDAFHLDSRRLVRLVPMDSRLSANRLGPVPGLNPELPAALGAAIEGCGPLALSKEALCIVEVGQGLAELELPDGPITPVLAAPGLPTGGGERKESREAVPESDNLWPGQALEAGRVALNGSWCAQHWRSAAPGQRFSGQCRVAARGLVSGWAEISLQFVDQDGRRLGPGQPAGPKGTGAVSAPASDPALLHLAATAPAGTDRVGLCLQVVKGNGGAGVSFHDVTFTLAP